MKKVKIKLHYFDNVKLDNYPVVQGYLFEHKQVKLVVHKQFEVIGLRAGGWQVSEFTTGYQFARSESTRSEAIDSAKYQFEKAEKANVNILDLIKQHEAINR